MLLEIAITGIWVFIVPIVAVIVGWFLCNSFQAKAAAAQEKIQDELQAKVIALEAAVKVKA